jgi:hypothetical protein
MKQKSGPDKAPAEQVLKNIRRQTRDVTDQRLLDLVRHARTMGHRSVRNLGYQAGAMLPDFAVGLEVQTLRPETNERFIPVAMLPRYYLLNIANFLNLPQPSWPPVESPEIDLAMLRFGVGRIDDRELARAKMRGTVIIGDRMQDAAARNVIEHRQCSQRQWRAGHIFGLGHCEPPGFFDGSANIACAESPGRSSWPWGASPMFAFVITLFHGKVNYR